MSILNKARKNGDVWHVAIGGFGGSAEGYDWFTDELKSTTGERVIFIESVRWAIMSPKDTPEILKPYDMPKAFVRQAYNIRNALLANNLRGRQVMVHAHSMGCPIAAIFALLFHEEFKIIGINLMNPACIQLMNVFKTSWRVLVRRTNADFTDWNMSRKIGGANTAAAIVDYYKNMLAYMFSNPIRTLAEAWATSRFKMRRMITGLALRKIPIFMGLSEIDEVFDYSYVRDATKEFERYPSFITYSTPGRHDPEYFARQLIEAMSEVGAL